MEILISKLKCVWVFPHVNYLEFVSKPWATNLDCAQPCTPIFNTAEQGVALVEVQVLSIPIGLFGFKPILQLLHEMWLHLCNRSFSFESSYWLIVRSPVLPLQVIVFI